MRRVPVPITALLRHLNAQPTAHHVALRLGCLDASLARGTTAFRPRRRLCTKSSPSPPAAPSPPPSSSSAVELSDREMVRRLLSRPQRVYWWLGGVALAGATLVAFGPELKLGVSKHTADVATRSLQDETLQSHTRELASQIVQTVLNDPNVLDQASRFLQRLVAMDITRDSLRALVVYTLNDPVTLQHVAQLARNLLSMLLTDPVTRGAVVTFLKQTMLDPQTREGLMKLLDEVMKDETVRRNLAQLLAQTFGTEPVKSSVSSTIGESVHDVLSRPDIQTHAKQFVGSVVQDQTVQAQSGDAIWGTVMYAITPSWLAWMWEAGDHDEPTAVESAAAVAGVATTLTTESKAEADAVVAETGEAFVDAVEKRVGRKDEDATTQPRAVGDGEPDASHSLVASDADAKPPSKLEMLRRLTMKLPHLLSWSSDTAATEAERQRLADEEAEKQKLEAEEYGERHWSGSGSGFL